MTLAIIGFSGHYENPLLRNIDADDYSCGRTARASAPRSCIPSAVAADASAAAAVNFPSSFARTHESFFLFACSSRASINPVFRFYELASSRDREYDDTPSILVLDGLLSTAGRFRSRGATRSDLLPLPARS